MGAAVRPHARKFSATRTYSLTLLVAATVVSIGYVFWVQDGQYSLPTPKPPAFYQPPIGSPLSLPLELKAVWSASGKDLLFIHTYNPYCPCSRFNLDHVQSLVEAHQGKVIFVALIQGYPSGPMLAKLRDRLHGMLVMEDRSGHMANALGVYSTPQAVILDRKSVLRFRGNYNASRYCNDPETEFARLALEALLLGTNPKNTGLSEISYGCPLLKRKQDRVPDFLQTAGF